MRVLAVLFLLYCWGLAVLLFLAVLLVCLLLGLVAWLSPGAACAADQSR
jgi:hypothetical protein